MLMQRKFRHALSAVFVITAPLLIVGCGGQEAPQDVVRKTTGSANKQGLWRMTETFEGEKFYSTAIMEGTGSSVTMTDCSRAFEVDTLKLSGQNYSGYSYDMAPLKILSNDSMSWTYSNQVRRFEKMDTNAKFNMGTFTMRSPLLPSVIASNLACVQFSETTQGEVMVLTTRVLGNPLMITINMAGGFKKGTFKIDPYGNEPAMVIFAGSHWVYTTLTNYDEISSGTLTIKSRGKVWIEGELHGVLRNGFTPMDVTFNVETPIN